MVVLYFSKSNYIGVDVSLDSISQAQTKSSNKAKFIHFNGVKLPFNDDEFEIIGFQEGCGVDEKTVIWKCKTTNNEEFNVRPIGDLEHRRLLFSKAPKYIGKMLTVKYQELSEIGVPRFPVGKDIRE